MNDVQQNLTWEISQLGFHAAFNQELPTAISIFEDINAAFEDDSGIKSGLAMVYVFSGKYEEAITLYRDDILENNPDDYSSKAFYGLSLCYTGDVEEGSSLLHDAHTNGDENAKEISQAYIEILTNENLLSAA